MQQPCHAVLSRTCEASECHRASNKGGDLRECIFSGRTRAPGAGSLSSQLAALQQHSAPALAHPDSLSGGEDDPVFRDAFVDDLFDTAQVHDRRAVYADKPLRVELLGEMFDCLPERVVLAGDVENGSSALGSLDCRSIAKS